MPPFCPPCFPNDWTILTQTSRAAADVALSTTLSLKSRGDVVLAVPELECPVLPNTQRRIRHMHPIRIELANKPARMIFAGLAIGVLVACGGSSSTGPSGPMSIAGAWNLSVNVSNSALSTSCTAQGQATVNQSGSQMSGTYNDAATCTGPGGTSSNNNTGTLTGGQISGSQVSFSDDGGCNYAGTGSGSPVNRMSGNASCTYAISGQNYAFTGTWQATR